MKRFKIMMAGAAAAAFLIPLAAMPQNEKQPIISSTGRFGDPTAIARKYQDYLFGVIKAINPHEVILSKTKFGVDQAFKFSKKTKFTADGKPSSLDKLKVGEGIYIDYDTDKKTGDFMVKKVVSGVDLPSIPSAE